MLPQILTLSLTALTIWIGWRLWRLSPARLKQIAPYREPRRALIVLTAREGHLSQQMGCVEEHIEAAMELGMSVLTVQQTESLIHSVVASIFRTGWQLPNLAETDLLMFTVSSEDAFDNADLEDLLVRLQVSELYLISGNPAFSAEATACSARARGYETRILRAGLQAAAPLIGRAPQAA